MIDLGPAAGRVVDLLAGIDDSQLGKPTPCPDTTVGDLIDHIDTLAVLEEKTANNLSPEEKRLLDSALYETRMRYVNVASQHIT